ncbi:hypothetical protein [Rhizobiales bacterium 3FA27D7]|uniref:hypothetical protein n=1 Tax=Mesorhizobium sp. 2RAF21 TaxID=3232995 RepID=UPI0010F4A1B3
MRIAAVLFSTMVITAVSAHSAGAAQSRFTSIANKDCKFAPIGHEPGEEDDQLKTCSGLGNSQVLVNALGTRLRIGFRWPNGGHPKKVIWIVEAWSAGFVVDWRGNEGTKGFIPYAAIVRMKFAKDGGPEVGDQVLAVLRVTPRMACVMGAVDAAVNRNANELAHEIADAQPSFICGKDKPAVGGVSTSAAVEIVKGMVDQ